MRICLNLSQIVQSVQDTSEPPSFKDHSIYAGHAVSGHGKRRRISAPNAAMQSVHQQFLAKLRERNIQCPSATGCKAGNSPLKNVLRHRIEKGRDGKPGFSQYFYLLDLKSAYESVRAYTLAQCLILHFPDDDFEEVHDFVSLYCIRSGDNGLYAGAPSSPDLFNIYCEHYLDAPLRKIAKKHDITYTRYLDDLTFSSTSPIGHRKRDQICDSLRDAGFDISHGKTKILDMSKGEIAINGIGLHPDGSTYLPRKNAEQISSLLHRAVSTLSPLIKNAQREHNSAAQMEIKRQIRNAHATLISLVNGKMGLYFGSSGKGIAKSSLDRKIRLRYADFKRLQASLYPQAKKKGQKRAAA